MKTIKEPVKNISLLWRRPQPRPGSYRLMRYLITAQTEDGRLFYNVVTSEMILLDHEEEVIVEQLPAPYNPSMDELIARHYLVPEDFDESKSVKELRALMQKLQPVKRVSGFTILPTTECNARCFYCFESDHKHCTLTDEKTRDVIEYINAKCKGEPIEIIWFGGEPLVASHRITQISEGLRQKGVKYRSTMVSNAYLFDEKRVKAAKDIWNLVSVQITLDGTEDVYNETKAYIRPKENPYHRVLRNIDLLLDQGIAVNVRLNVTNRNVQDLYQLINELAERFAGKKRFTCYAHGVYEGVGFSPLAYSDSTRSLVEEQTVAIDSRLIEKGLLGSFASLPYFHFVRCMSDNDACRLIYPDGTIGKCENRPSTECIGDIYHDVTDREMEARYKVVEEIPVCRNCFLYPECINLKICPETGQCSEARVRWKKEKYRWMMIDEYRRKNGPKGNEEEESPGIEVCSS